MPLAALIVLVVASTAGGASSSGTLVFAGASDPTYLDPALVSDGESFRVTEQMFEGLVKLRPGTTKIVPSLATSWKLSGGGKVWTFNLRKGVKFHDGSDFNADAAIWNLDRYFKKDAKQFDPPGGAVAQARNPFVASYRKIDDNTIEITNPRPLSYFPNMLPYLLYSSPAQFEKTGSWAEFAKAPSGTGPFKITEFK
ncbi:MAG: ABC transporter substrate-binding protein, partial [Gaiellaceae bacterium]